MSLIALMQPTSPCPFKGGDIVIIAKPAGRCGDLTKPFYSWGNRGISLNMIGRIHRVGNYGQNRNSYMETKEDWEVWVDFPRHSQWHGLASEFIHRVQSNDDALALLKPI